MLRTDHAPSSSHHTLTAPVSRPISAISCPLDGSLCVPMQRGDALCR